MVDSPAVFKPLIGYFLAVFGLTTSALSACCVQALRGAVPDFELSIIRTGAQLIFYYILGRCRGENVRVRTESLPALIYMSVGYMLWNVGFYGASVYLPLVEAMRVVIMAEIMSAFIHARVLFHVEITKSQVLSCFICGLGIILTAQPAWLFKLATSIDTSSHQVNITLPIFDNYITLGNTSSALTSNADRATSPASNSSINYVHQLPAAVTADQVLMGYVLSAMGGAAFGGTYDVNAVLLADIPVAVKGTHLSVLCTVSSVAFMMYLEDPVLLNLTLHQLLLVLGHAALSPFASLFCILAGNYLSGGRQAVVAGFSVMLTLLGQYTLMHSIMPGNYNWMEVFGCVVLLTGASVSPAMDIIAQNAKADEIP